MLFGICNILTNISNTQKSVYRTPPTINHVSKSLHLITSKALHRHPFNTTTVMHFFSSSLKRLPSHTTPSVTPQAEVMMMHHTSIIVRRCWPILHPQYSREKKHHQECYPEADTIETVPAFLKTRREWEMDPCAPLHSGAYSSH